MQFTGDSFLQDIKSSDKDEHWDVLSSAGDASLLLKVNSCNGAYFRQTKRETIALLCSELSLACFLFLFLVLFCFFFPHFSQWLCWRLDAVRIRWTMKSCTYDRLCTIDCRQAETQTKKEKNTSRHKYTVQIFIKNTNYLLFQVHYFAFTAWTGGSLENV